MPDAFAGRTIMSILLAASLAAPTALRGQEVERYALSGDDVAVYNLAGELRVEAGSGANVIIELSRGGDDGGELDVETNPIRGRQTLRVRYPSDRIVYPQLGRRSRTTVRVRGDGTFFGDDGGRGDRVTITGSGSGLEAYADVRVLVPEGRRVAVYLGVGRAYVANVNGDLLVDVATASIESRATRGRLRLDTGSGSISVTDAQGDVGLDTGSGNIDVNGVSGERLIVDTGSGGVRGGAIAVGDLDVDTGSGSIDLDRVRASDVRLDTGSGSVRLGLLADVRSMDIDTGSGTVTLTVPATLSARIELDTGSGGIDVELPLQLLDSRRDYLLAQLGNGDGSIKVETGSGSIRVRPGS